MLSDNLNVMVCLLLMSILLDGNFHNCSSIMHIKAVSGDVSVLMDSCLSLSPSAATVATYSASFICRQATLWVCAWSNWQNGVECKLQASKSRLWDLQATSPVMHGSLCAIDAPEASKQTLISELFYPCNLPCSRLDSVLVSCVFITFRHHSDRSTGVHG